MAHLDEMTSRETGRGEELEGVGEIYRWYADTKLAMMLFTAELNMRQTSDNVVCLAAHPGSTQSLLYLTLLTHSLYHSR